MQWLTEYVLFHEPENSRQKEQDGKMSVVQMFCSLCGECVEFLSQRRSRAILMESRHRECQTDKQGLIRGKGVTECWQLVFDTCLDGQPVKGSEKGWNMIFFLELLWQVLQLSFGPFVVFQEDVKAAWEERVTIIKPREDRGGHKCFVESTERRCRIVLIWQSSE